MRLNLAGDWPSPLGAAVRLMDVALAEAAGEDSGLVLPAGVINLKLVDDAEIAALNKRYSGNAYPTDVLTFAYGDEPASSKPTAELELADIVISADTAARQAAAAGTGLPDEVALLALHGILHVLGCDHADAAGQDRVQRLQASVMTRAGLTYREFEWTN